MESGSEFLGPVNLGNPDELTVRALAERIIDLTGSRSRLVFKQLPNDDPKQRQPDIRLAREKLGWSPTWKLDDGLRQTIKYFDTMLSGAEFPEKRPALAAL
jgi:UDP-glucuronate decarboxylase